VSLPKDRHVARTHKWSSSAPACFGSAMAMDVLSHASPLATLARHWESESAQARKIQKSLRIRHFEGNDSKSGQQNRKSKLKTSHRMRKQQKTHKGQGSNRNRDRIEIDVEKGSNCKLQTGLHEEGQADRAGK
jgi:hypothetical protein